MTVEMDIENIDVDRLKADTAYWDMIAPYNATHAFFRGEGAVWEWWVDGHVYEYDIAHNDGPWVHYMTVGHLSDVQVLEKSRIVRPTKPDAQKPTRLTSEFVIDIYPLTVGRVVGYDPDEGTIVKMIYPRTYEYAFASEHVDVQVQAQSELGIVIGAWERTLKNGDRGGAEIARTVVQLIRNLANEQKGA